MINTRIKKYILNAYIAKTNNKSEYYIRNTVIYSFNLV